MLRFIFAVALVGACVAINTKLDDEWEAYKQRYGKEYSGQEDLTRRGIFESNVELIKKHNERYDKNLTSYDLRLNKFADMTNEEYRKYLGAHFVDTSMPDIRRAEPEMEFDYGFPDKVDWREKGYVTPVKDQGGCRASWAFSTTGSIEGQHFARTGNLVSLSEQNLIDCSSGFGNDGCNEGSIENAFNYVLAKGGIETEKNYPYVGVSGSCRTPKSFGGVTIEGYQNIPSQDVTTLKTIVAFVGPVSVAIDASQPSFQLYGYGIYDEPECSSTALNHAALVVGYGSENGKDYWIVKNSWGTSWGEEGYIRMSRKKGNQCGITTRVFFPNPEMNTDDSI